MNIRKSLSFCASYNEATSYEVSATFASPLIIKSVTFAKFVHDNAYFNIYTDGKVTFHYMRSIEIITPGDSIQPRQLIQLMKPLKTFKDHLNLNLLKKFKHDFCEHCLMKFANMVSKLDNNPTVTRNGQLNISDNNDNIFPEWNELMNLITNVLTTIS